MAPPMTPPMAPTEPVAAAPMDASEGSSRLERIARRAYEIYQRRGGEHGRQMDDWLEAEREIDREG